MTSQYTPLWLRSDKNWKVRLQDGWEGDRMLGQGSYGIAGHWKYKGPIETAPNIKDIVVKQSQLFTYTADEDPCIEGRLLELLASVESRHILRQYGPLVEDDENGLPVIKLFLEYCPGGDMLRLMESSRIMGTGVMVKKPQNPFLEADIWAMFNCLALGLAVVDRGTEDEFAPAWNRDTEITHNDLKLDNVFMGYRDPDHERWPVLKIADFGVAIEEPKVQTFQYGENLESAAPRISNLLKMITKRKFFGAIRRGAAAVTKDSERGGESSGLDLDIDVMRNLYSSRLRELVIRCLMRESLLRPTALQLQGEVRLGLEAAMSTAKKTNAFKNNVGMIYRIDMNDHGRIWAEPPVLVDVKGVVIPQRQPNASRKQGQTLYGELIWTSAGLVILIGYILYMWKYVIEIDMRIRM